MKIRIKTKEEFISEFGQHWREDVSHYCFYDEAMDYLLGVEMVLDKQQISCFNEFDKFILDGWAIYGSMFTIISSNNIEHIKIDSSMISCQNIFCNNYGKHFNLNCSKVNHLSDICKVKSCETLINFIKYFENI